MIPESATTEPATAAESVSADNDSSAAAKVSRVHAPLAGVTTALVGFTSSFAVVLTGLQAVGATDAQASSGLMVMCLLMAAGMIFLSLRYRMPITLAWSTPGAALLAGAGTVAGGWPAAVGAFMVTGLLVMLTGVWSRLGELIAAIPVPLAQAMLAGVILPLCLEPVTAASESPWMVLPIIAVWLLFQRISAKWAVPAAFLTAAVIIGIDIVRNHKSINASDLAPHLEFVAPQWTWQAIFGIALPLYLVTMGSQNVPGTAIMGSFGYQVPWRSSMLTTGTGTALGSMGGVHAINLAAISAALAAAPAAHPDPRRRWVAATTAGISYAILGIGAAALATLVAVAPSGVIETVAGLALLGTLATALGAALGDIRYRESAAITFVIAASGVTFGGIEAAFWALLAGLLVHTVLGRRTEISDVRR